MIINDISELKHRVELQQPFEIDDGAGGVHRTYTPLTTLWAAIRNITPKERLSQDKLNQAVKMQIIIRHRTDLTRHHRFLYQSRVFLIQSFERVDEERWFQTINVEEEMP